MFAICECLRGSEHGYQQKHPTCFVDRLHFLLLVVTVNGLKEKTRAFGPNQAAALLPVVRQCFLPTGRLQISDWNL
jgi:hypothetical protein